MGYLIASYAVVGLGLAGYALHLSIRCRALRARLADEGRASPRSD